MIPLGATLSKDLYILGCDGRKPDENYFWKHDKASQFSRLMQELNFHPDFSIIVIMRIIMTTIVII